MAYEIKNQVNLGIDPGKRGCIVLEDMKAANGAAVRKPWGVYEAISGYTRFNVFDLADFLTPYGEFDISLIWAFFKGLEPLQYNLVAALERVHEMPGNMGMFTFGHGVGLIQMSFQGNALEYFNPTPQFWKSKIGIPKEYAADKDYSRGYAGGLCPELEPFLRLKKHSDRAEAFLLAQFAAKVSDGLIEMPAVKKLSKPKKKKKVKPSVSQVA